MKLILIQIGLKVPYVADNAEPQEATFSITDTKLYVPVVTLSKCKTAWTIIIKF